MTDEKPATSWHKLHVHSRLARLFAFLVAADDGGSSSGKASGTQALVIRREEGCCGVGDLAGGNDCEVGQGMWLGVVGADDVENLPALGDELVGDEAAVAAPGEGFGAHDGGARVAGEGLEFVERSFEFFGEHVVGVGGEGGDVPGGVVGGFDVARGAAAAEVGEVGVGDAEVLERGERASRLNCGWRREPGKRRTSARHSIFSAASRARKSCSWTVGVADGAEGWHLGEGAGAASFRCRSRTR